MSRIRLALVVLCWMQCSSVIWSADPGLAVIGYLPEYRVAQVRPSQLHAITDLVYFGIEPTSDGVLPMPLISEGVLEKLHTIQRATHCRLLLCVGGWNRSESFATLAADDIARQRFVRALVTYCQAHAFDGIDYDWEHPKNADELRAYVRLLADTKALVADGKFFVTVAQAGWQDLGKDAYSAVDRVHLMAYDHDFPHSTLEKSIADLDRVLQFGCPPHKLALGLPFYGRDRSRDARTYAELVTSQHPAPHVDEIDGFAFNGPRTIAKKVELAHGRGLAGVMIWELGQDSSQRDASLLAAIEKQRQVLLSQPKR